MILVTGASGFLGGRLARVLRDRGEKIRVLARPTSDLSHLPGVEVVLDPRQAMIGVSTVFHCAAKSADWGTRGEFRTANVDLVQTLVDAARAENVERFVHVSTTDVYGYPHAPCAEDHPLVRRGFPYNETKIESEEIVWRAHAEGLAVTVVRPATIYGPRSESTVADFADLVQKGEMVHIGGGEIPAGLVYVDDVVDAMIVAASAPIAVGRAYNLCHPSRVTWRQYVGAMAERIGVAAPKVNLPTWLALVLARVSELFAGKKRPLLTRHAVELLGRSQAFPIGRAEADLGFRPRVEFGEGMRLTMDWWDGRRKRSAS